MADGLRARGGICRRRTRSLCPCETFPLELDGTLSRYHTECAETRIQEIEEKGRADISWSPFRQSEATSSLGSQLASRTRRTPLRAIESARIESLLLRQVT